VENLTFDPLTANIGINTITASFTDVNGCQGAAILNITVEECAALDNPLTSSIDIFPNPTSGVFTVRGVPINSHLQVLDLNGKIIYKSVTAHSSVEVSLLHISNGLYYLEIDDVMGNSQRKKFFLNK